MWQRRKDSVAPYQTWREFASLPQETIVEVENAYGCSRQAKVKDLWWGYETEMGQVGEGVIIKARVVPAEVV